MARTYEHDWVDLTVAWYGDSGERGAMTLSGRGEDNHMVVLQVWYFEGPVMEESVYWDVLRVVQAHVTDLLVRQFVLQLQMPFEDDLG